MVTGDEVKQSMIKKEILEVSHHKCSICGYMTKYIRKGNELFFDPGCYCSSSGIEKRSWDDIVNWIEMQSNEKLRRI